MGSSFIFFVIAIVIIGSIISSIARNNTSKNKRNHNTQKQAQTPSAPTQRSGGVDLASEINKKPLNRPIMKTSFQEEADKSKTKKQSEYEAKNPHPSAQRNVRVEKVVIEDSMGEHQTQGCSEHYYDRYVLIEENINKNQSGLNKELAKYIVMGEVLNKPSFKKYRR